MKMKVGVIVVLMMMMGVMPAFCEMITPDWIEYDIIEAGCIYDRCEDKGGITNLSQKPVNSMILTAMTCDCGAEIHMTSWVTGCAAYTEKQSHELRINAEYEAILNWTADVAEIPEDMENRIGPIGDIFCDECGRYYPKKLAEYMLLEGQYDQAFDSDGNKYFIHRSIFAITEDNATSERKLLSKNGDNIYLYSYDPSVVDIYMIRDRAIYPVYYTIMPGTQLFITNNIDEGKEYFLVCDTFSECTSCEKYVACNNGSNSMQGEIILSDYCPDHTCHFIWDVMNNSDSGEVEGLVCQNEKANGSDYCADHKCKACGKPIIGRNIYSGANLQLENYTVENYQGNDRAQYSNFCETHYCKEYNCNSGKARVREDELFCTVHDNCLVAGCDKEVTGTWNGFTMCDDCKKCSGSTDGEHIIELVMTPRTSKHSILKKCRMCNLEVCGEITHECTLNECQEAECVAFRRAGTSVQPEEPEVETTLCADGEHRFEYQRGTDAFHYRTCRNCPFKDNEPHTFNNGECRCGARNDESEVSDPEGNDEDDIASGDGEEETETTPDACAHTNTETKREKFPKSVTTSGNGEWDQKHYVVVTCKDCQKEISRTKENHKEPRVDHYTSVSDTEHNYYQGCEDCRYDQFIRREKHKADRSCCTEANRTYYNQDNGISAGTGGNSSTGSGNTGTGDNSSTGSGKPGTGDNGSTGGDKDDGDKEETTTPGTDETNKCTHVGYAVVLHENYLDITDTKHKVEGKCMDCGTKCVSEVQHVYVNGKCECGHELPSETIIRNNMISLEVISPTKEKLKGGELIKVKVTGNEDLISFKYVCYWGDKSIKAQIANKEAIIGNIPAVDGPYYLYIYSVTDKNNKEIVVNAEYKFVVDKNAADLEDYLENEDENQDNLNDRKQMCSNCGKETLFSTTEDGKEYCIVCATTVDGDKIEVDDVLIVEIRLCKKCGKTVAFLSDEKLNACPECGESFFAILEDTNEGGAFYGAIPGGEDENEIVYDDKR